MILGETKLAGSGSFGRRHCCSAHSSIRVGAVGLLLLIYAALTTGISAVALVALAILAIAALGGFYLASIHLRGKVAQRLVVFIHAGVAVVGFLTLLGVVFEAL